MFIKLETNEIYTYQKLKKEFGASYSSDFRKGLRTDATVEKAKSIGFDIIKTVKATTQPTKYQILVRSDVTFVDGIPTITETIEDKPQSEILEMKTREMTKVIDTLIQSKIKKYNEDNGVMFENINSVYKYTADTSYTHYAFCNAITLWNIQVWETARQIQIDVLAGNRTEPTQAELLAELPQLSY